VNDKQVISKQLQNKHKHSKSVYIYLRQGVFGSIQTLDSNYFQNLTGTFSFKDTSVTKFS